ncbi:MAG: hypothetical protein JNM93_00365 [Bacteriovoracaceae bacterium]|jgi:hypothetical protein|nr:hypothetical protein [Bacteriovoracaceae bacterium]
MKAFKSSLFLGLMLNFSLVFAHGMNKPGPNGGEIRMPGPFHTEAKAEGANKLKVYLLDMNFKNPVTANSSVEVTFSGHHKTKASCEKSKDYFLCSFEGGVDLQKEGTIEIKAVRDSKKGSIATYKTPLMAK